MATVIALSSWKMSLRQVSAAWSVALLLVLWAISPLASADEFNPNPPPVNNNSSVQNSDFGQLISTNTAQGLKIFNNVSEAAMLNGDDTFLESNQKRDDEHVKIAGASSIPSSLEG